ncbi:MAG: hypothetical protein U0Q22_11580 [Acidimicrobiales bacterium]
MTPNTSSLHGSPLAAAVRAAGEPLRELIRTLDPREVPLPFAPDVLAAFAEVQRVAESGRVLMTARAAEAQQWERDRFPSAADWLAAQLGTTPGRARADLETSERLGSLDATADAVRAGLLSPEQAGAVADAAAVNPAAEEDLLDQAQRDSLRRTRQEAERRKAEAQSEQEKAEREERVTRERDVRFWYGNGAGHMEVRGPVAAMKDLEQRIQREVDQAFRAHRPLPVSQRGTRGNYAFDALMAFGRGGSGGGGRTGSERKRASLTRMTFIKVDLAALLRGRVGVGERCEIGGVAVSVAALRELLGDSVLQLVLTNGEAVVDVVNLNRRPTVSQKVAKFFTDSTCCVQGCDRAARLEFDHRDDWARVRVTEVANLDLLCDHHHDLKTYENWQMVEGEGRRPMMPPKGARRLAQSARAAPMGAAASAAAAAPAADLVARLERIKRKEADRQARMAGQDTLFDTG